MPGGGTLTHMFPGPCLAFAQISRIMGDLQAEVKRINSANSSSSSAGSGGVDRGSGAPSPAGSAAQEPAAAAALQGKQQAPHARKGWRQAAAADEGKEVAPQQQQQQAQRLDWRQLAAHLRALR